MRSRSGPIEARFLKILRIGFAFSFFAVPPLAAIVVALPICEARGEADFATVGEINSVFAIHPAAQLDPDEWVDADAEMVSRLRESVETASQFLQGRDHDTDTYCPIEFGIDEFFSDPFEGWADGEGNAPIGSTFTPPFANTVHMITGGPAAGSTAITETGATILKVGPNWEWFMNTARMHAHETGHLAGLSDCNATLMHSIYNTCTQEPGNGGKLREWQCEAFKRYANFDAGTKAECLLEDPALPDPIYAAPRWSTCRSGSGYCDGVGRCIGSDLQCMGSAGPLPRGTDCSDANLCRACTTRLKVGSLAFGLRGGTLAPACVPCATPAETISTSPTVYFVAPLSIPAGPDANGNIIETAPGGLWPSETLYQFEVGLIPRLEKILDLERDVVGLAAQLGTSTFFTVAPQEAGDDLLLRLEPRGNGVIEVGLLGRTDVAALVFGAESSTLYGAEVDPVTGSSQLIGIHPEPPVSSWVIGPIDAAFVTDLAFDPVAGRLWAAVDAGAALLELDPGTGATIGQPTVFPTPFPSIAFDPELWFYSPALWGLPADGSTTGLTVDPTGGTGYVFPVPAVKWQQGFALAGLCGNGIEEYGEDCDDGNVYDGDHCNSACRDNTQLLPAAYTDQDGDTVVDAFDNSPAVSNPDQLDTDEDGVGDASDNCPDHPNLEQTNVDQDNWGDSCDNSPTVASDNVDTEGDGIGDVVDNCPSVGTYDRGVSLLAASQTNTDGDTEGDICDADDDSDGLLDVVDNCPLDENPDQADFDGDGVGDPCDVCAWDPFNDEDGDGRCYLLENGDVWDNCPAVANIVASQYWWVDYDEDGFGKVCDNCWMDFNSDQADLDGDGAGDACDDDDDGDGFDDALDTCPMLWNQGQTDLDGDGVGDACDNCTWVANPRYDLNAGYGPQIFSMDAQGRIVRTTTGGQLDDDADGYGNACDGDYDGDGVVGALDLAAFGQAAGREIFETDCVLDADTSPCDVFDTDGEKKRINGRLDWNPSFDDWTLFETCPTCPLACLGDVCDADADGIADQDDNCSEVPNGSGDVVGNQLDTDADGYGNICDADVNNESRVNAFDYHLLVAGFGSQEDDPEFDPDLDLNGDGGVGAPDLAKLTEQMNGAGVPGPSGLACAGTAPCISPTGDQDGDEVPNSADNCMEYENRDQRDPNLDGYGVACDWDYDDDGDVDLTDFDALMAAYGLHERDRGYDENMDHNGDKTIGDPDFAFFTQQQEQGFPGPSGLACAGSSRCTAP